MMNTREERDMEGETTAAITPSNEQNRSDGWRSPWSFEETREKENVGVCSSLGPPFSITRLYGSMRLFTWSIVL